MYTRTNRSSDPTVRDAAKSLLNASLCRGLLNPLDVAVSIYFESGGKLLNQPPVLKQTLKGLRDAQVGNLEALGYPGEVLKKVPLPKEPVGLLVIPASEGVPLKAQMKMAGIETDSMDIVKDFDKDQRITQPYWVYDIEFELFPQSTVNAIRAEILDRGRVGLRFIEGVHLYIQAPSLLWKLRDIHLLGATDYAAPHLQVFHLEVGNIVVRPNNYYGEEFDGAIPTRRR